MPTSEQRRSGQRLRYQLTLILHGAGRPLTVQELIDAMEAADHEVPGRASKTVSDALRQEIRRGRVKRWRRSTYGAQRIPESTVRWMRDRAGRPGSAVF